jgi:hypothetical protein
MRGGKGIWTRYSGRAVEERIASVSGWSRREVLAMLNPFSKALRIAALAVALMTLVTRLWAAIYDALAFMAVDRDLGIFGSTRHAQAVARMVFATFVGAVAVQCLLEGQTLTYVLRFAVFAVAGGIIGDRRMRVRVASGVVFSPNSRLRKVVVRLVGGKR